jgi:hypothetical protein
MSMIGARPNAAARGGPGDWKVFSPRRPGDVTVKIGEVEFDGFSRSVSLEPTTPDPEVLQSFGGPIQSPAGLASWTLNFGSWHDMSDDGTDAELQPLIEAGDPVDFSIIAGERRATGKVYPEAYTWGGEASSPWELDLAWPVLGQPVFDEAPAPPANGAAAAKAK